MTTFMLEEIDWSTREIKVRFLSAIHYIYVIKVYSRGVQTSVSVCHDMASHPNMLTDKELDSVTASFKSLESGLRGATIKQEVQEHKL